jgi:xylulokinase
MFLGFDIGTSGVKAVLIDERGDVRHQTTHAYPTTHPHPLWSEQDPADWWRACLDATAALRLAGADLNAVRAVGLSGQMHGATLLDQDGRVLRPCILWNDGRSHAECAELESRVANFHDRSGNMAMPGFTAPKLLWLRKHEPAVFDRIATVLLPKDYILYRMTGGYSSDMSDAAGTLWMNIEQRDWDDALLAATGLGREHMPTLHEGCEPVGKLTRAAAAELGLPVVPVVAGAGDNPGGAVGVGVIDPGQALLSLGTSGVLLTVSDRHRAHPEQTVHAFCHCLPGRWLQMSVCLSAAHSLAWLARTVGVPVADLLARLEISGQHETSVLFLPYLFGERTPHNDPRADPGSAGRRGLRLLRRPRCTVQRRQPARGSRSDRRRRPFAAVAPVAGRCAGIAAGLSQRQRSRTGPGRGAAGHDRFRRRRYRGRDPASLHPTDPADPPCAANRAGRLFPRQASPLPPAVHAEPGTASGMTPGLPFGRLLPNVAG